MGVSGLQSFARSVDGGYRIVNLKEALKAQRSNPILVVDLFSFHMFVCTNEHENLLGGRFNKFNERMEDGLNSLKSMGYELIFFADGVMQPDKMATGLKRREDDYSSGIKVLHDIDEGLDLTYIFSKNRLPSVKSYFENMIQIAAKYGEVHISVLNECDQEIVHLANTKKALAVISTDTDFIIFDGSWRLWSDLNFVNNTALEYDKNKIRECLKLSCSQMKLFASLAGNDFVSYKLLHNFNHKQNYKRQFYKIAEKVRKTSELNNMDLKSLSKDIFEQENYQQGLRALEKSVSFYSLDGMKITYSDNFQEQVAQRSRFIYAMLYGDEIIMHCTYCDLTKIDFLDLYKPLLCRLIGLLFANRKMVNTGKIFYFRINGRFKAITLYATFPPTQDKVPQLKDLLLTPYGEDKILDSLRWELLCFVISSNKLKPSEVRSIPGNNRATYLTLYYLVKANLIGVDEADCILFSCNVERLPNLQDKFRLDAVKTINGRDARVVFLFERMMYEMPACFSAVGLKQFAGLITFDGLYFHNLRKIWNTLDSDLLKSIQTKLQPFRIYA